MNTLFVAAYLLCGFSDASYGPINGCHYQASRATFESVEECRNWLAENARSRRGTTLEQRVCIPLNSKV